VVKEQSFASKIRHGLSGFAKYRRKVKKGDLDISNKVVISNSLPFLLLQATQEQIRLALLTNDAHSIDDSVFKQKVKQV